MAKFGSVDEYVASLPAAHAETMRRMIDAALGADSRLDVKLAWNVPQVHLGKSYVIGFSAAKAHLSAAPWSKDVMAAFADRLASLDPTDNMFRVAPGWEVDTVLIHDLVHARLAELGEIA
jgi:uncharacterized protein YdhG (YjbR/CyaY superfamily)